LKFTKNSLPNGSDGLISFLIRSCLPTGSKIEKNSLVNIYDTNTVIKKLEVKIKRHQNDARYKKFVPLWEAHIVKIKGLK